MAKENTLLEKREELKRQLAAGEYKTLTDMSLDGIDHLIQRLTRNPALPFWYSTTIIALVTLLISSVTSIIIGESYPIRREMILFEISTVGFILAGMTANRVCISRIFTILRVDIVDAIESVADLVDLQRWLKAVCNVKNHLFFSMAYSILASSLSLILFAVTKGGFVGFGPTIFLVIVHFQGGMLGYYVFAFLAAPIRLSRYQYKLYSSDPSSSEVISRLSSMLSSFLYFAAVLVAVATLIAASFGLMTSVITVLVVLALWGFLAALFITNQIALGKIIVTDKWKTLNEVQAAIDKLKAEQSIVDKETMEAINRLMDYHDRVRATRSSALDLRTGLNFLNSLLLPLVAFLLANHEKLLEFFK